MSTSPVVALRLDPEKIERLDDEAELRGHTRSSLARHLIRQRLRDLERLSAHDQQPATERQP
jgi:predicted DNA-binding protein